MKEGGSAPFPEPKTKPKPTTKCCPCSPPWVRNPELEKANEKESPHLYKKAGGGAKAPAVPSFHRRLLGKPDEKEKKLAQEYQEWSRR